MDVLKMIAELRAERAQIEEAILTIERLAAGTRGKRRGRPPKWMSSAPASSGPASEATPKPKRTMSPAARKKIALAQKKRWTAQKADAEPAQ